MSTKKILESLANQIIGETVQRPSRQLAGHAGGLLFEDLIHTYLKRQFPDSAFRHFEALNYVMSRAADGDPLWRPTDDFMFGNAAIHHLVSRGKSAVKRWRLENPFEEKQNDTAESIVFSEPLRGFDSNLVSLIDVKTQRSDRESQPPNIISAKKLAKTAELVLESKREPNFEILYMGVKYQPTRLNDEEVLQAREAAVIDLFKIVPDRTNLYINWSAALQIQFYPQTVMQQYEGTRREWFHDFLEYYTNSLQGRIDAQSTQVAYYRQKLSTYSKYV